MAVSFSCLRSSFELHQEEYEEAALRVLRSGWYIAGNELASFEQEFAAYHGMRYCVGVGNGLDALIFAVRALGIGAGDEVIVAGNTYIATVLGITDNGATPVFVDCNQWFEIDENLVEAAITDKTRAVMVTNLYGQSVNLGAVRALCDKHGLYMIEDCAQSHGSSFNGLLCGTVGDVTCFSFYPTKPAGAFGDAGAVLTNMPQVERTVRMLRNYGSEKKYYNAIQGRNSRLDEIQAAMLRVALSHLDESNALRQHIASRYREGITNPNVVIPTIREGATHVWHIFPLLCEQRDNLAEHLKAKGVGTAIHYPIPPHLAECYEGEAFARVSLPLTEAYANTELSLPIYCGMTEEEIDEVIAAVNSFNLEEVY